MIERRLKYINNISSIVSTICTGPSYKSREVIENIMPVMDFPLPNKKEILNSLNKVVKGTEGVIQGIKGKTEDMKEDLINSVSGLTLNEAEAAFSKSIVAFKDWNLDYILEEKKQIIRKDGMLDYIDNTVSIDDIGGLKNLVEWIKDRKECFSQEAKDYGIRSPRGLLSIGLPGCVLADTKIKIKKVSKEGKIKKYEK